LEPAGNETRSRRVRAKNSSNLSFEFAQDSTADVNAEDWRQDLKKKLAQVQEKKRRLAPAAVKPSKTTAPLQPSHAARAPEIRRTFVDPQPIKKTDYDIHQNLRDFQSTIQKLPPTHPSKARSLPASAQRELPRIAQSETSSLPVSVRVERTLAEPEWIADKGILMTRTLSGLIDLCCVFICVTLFLLVSLRWGRIDVLAHSFRPILWGSAAFFQIFYSIYFLALTHRTPGMMITGLRVTDEQSGTPQFQQILLRTLFFFFSWGLALFGLLWGIWDKRSRCLHDFLSRTIVVRC